MKAVKITNYSGQETFSGSELSWFHEIGLAAQSGVRSSSATKHMETVIAILVVGFVGALLSLPLILIFHLTKRWKHYRVVWLLLVVADIVAVAFFLTSLLTPRRAASGPTGPFGAAPIYLLWLLALLATLFTLVYAFVWGLPRRKSYET